VTRTPQSGRIFQRYLDGCRVLEARDAAEAERLSRRQLVHALIVVDPAAQDGRPHLEGPTGEVPVFCCSLHAAATGLELGAAERLVKPVTHRQVEKALRRLGRGVRDVLIVDDDPDMVELLGEMVRAASRRYRIRTAQDGETGLAMLRERRADAVLLDLLMPGMDGYQVLEAMRADPEYREIPVVVVTARGQESEVIRSTALSISRSSGLGIGEVVRCINASLDALLRPSARSDSDPARTAAPPG
jgi:CheY-like chemotaxis protein